MREAIGIVATLMVVITLGVGIGLALSNKSVDVEKVVDWQVKAYLHWVERDNSTGLLRGCVYSTRENGFNLPSFPKCTVWAEGLKDPCEDESNEGSLYYDLFCGEK